MVSFCIVMISMTMLQLSKTLTIIQTIYLHALCLGLWFKEKLAGRPPFLDRCPVYVAPFLIDIPSDQCVVVKINQGYGLVAGKRFH